MQLIYLYHSGFALLFDRMTVVFDFYEDSLGPNSGCLHSDLLRRPVPLYVLASHFHADHFNPHIFSWREQKADVRYILSKDIWRHRRSCCRDVEAHWLIKDGTYTDDLLSVRAFGSTDVGVSFLLETEGLRKELPARAATPGGLYHGAGPGHVSRRPAPGAGLLPRSAAVCRKDTHALLRTHALRRKRSRRSLRAAGPRRRQHPAPAP